MSAFACRRALLAALVLTAACNRTDRDAAPPDEAAPPPSNRIAVPAAVRQSLGIRFVPVERRRVAVTLRVPGQFESLPAAVREYRTPLDGRVEILVAPLQRVAPGDLLARLDAPAWRAQQRELGEHTTSLVVLESRRAAMQPLLEAHREHEQSLAEAAQVLAARVRDLEATRQSIGGHAAEIVAAQVQLAQLRAEGAEAAEKHANLEATLVEIEATMLATRDRIRLALDAAAALHGIERAELEAIDRATGLPAWRTLGAVAVRAAAAGTVDALPVATGGFVAASDLMVATVDLQHVRFHARALQSDLHRLRDGLPARVVPPLGGFDTETHVTGRLELGTSADPRQRTIALFVRPDAVAPWTRPGVSAFVEIETDSSAPAELSIPTAAVLQDGLDRVLFCRDPKDPDKVIRLSADLGLDDGRFVVVESGLADGDEVVLDGAYELMLASSGQQQKGGHFHADGSFHADDHGPEGK